MSGSKRASNRSTSNRARCGSRASELLDVPLTERETGLVGVLGEAAQDIDLGGGQPGQQDQTVETVGFDRAGQQTLDRAAHLGVAQITDLDAIGDSHPDVVHEALGAVDHESVRMLVERPQSEVSEQRQEIRQGDRNAPVVHAHPPHTLGGIDRARQRGQGRPFTGDQFVEPSEVTDRRLRVDAGAIAVRCDGADPLQQRRPTRLAELVARRVGDAIDPRRGVRVDDVGQIIEVG